MLLTNIGIAFLLSYCCKHYRKVASNFLSILRTFIFNSMSEHIETQATEHRGYERSIRALKLQTDIKRNPKQDLSGLTNELINTR